VPDRLYGDVNVIVTVWWHRTGLGWSPHRNAALPLQSLRACGEATGVPSAGTRIEIHSPITQKGYLGRPIAVIDAAACGFA